METPNTARKPQRSRFRRRRRWNVQFSEVIIHLIVLARLFSLMLIDFSYFSFCVRILEVYDECMKKNLARATDLLEELSVKLTTLDTSGCDDKLYLNCKDTISHIVLACKTLMAILGGKNDEEVSKVITIKFIFCNLSRCVDLIFTNSS